MRKKYLNIIMCTSLLTLAGCSKEADIAVPDSAKHPIELAVGVESPMTRAVVTDGDGKTLTAFNAATDIWMVMKSEYKALSDNDLNFKGDRPTQYCVTCGTTGDKINDDKENKVSISGDYIRYWDDAHARSSALSVWALAVPEVTGTNVWGKTAKNFNADSEDLTVSWEIPAAQDASSVKNKDLCFSNNIVGETNTMRYSNQQSLKFDQGKLIFYHALSKITIKMVPGEGFKKDGSDFKFDGTSASGSAPVTMKGFNLNGTFNVADGEFASTSSNGDITSVGIKSTSNTDGYVLEALVMPGTSLGNSTNTTFAFSLDGNAFEVSSETVAASLRTALSLAETANVTLEAGINYILTFTINKTSIKLVATIGAWKDVEGTSYSPLINISDTYGHTGTEFAKGFSFYMKEASVTNFAKGTDVEYNADAVAPARKYSLTTPLYWPNHNTHYNFRGVYPTVGDCGTPAGNVAATAVNVANAAYSSGTFPSDLMIGYPRIEGDAAADETCKPHSKAGICATEGDIRMNFLYAMSQVEVKLISDPSAVGKAESSKVTLNDKATIEILGGYTEGNIALMTGLATGTTKTDWTMAGGTALDRHDAIIPQSLNGLQFRVKVDGGNDTYDYYYATICEIKVEGQDITSWEPGKHYIYTLNITKTGIKITATLKDWIEVRSEGNHIWM